MTYLHRKNIVHGDLKGVSYDHLLPYRLLHDDMLQANILVGDDRHALLADFGISRILDDGNPSAILSNPSSSSQGTLRWMAPERFDINTARPTKASDVYSFAITAWQVRISLPWNIQALEDLQIFSGENPFEGLWDYNIPQTVKNNIRPRRPQSLEVNDAVWRLIQSCWKTDPAQRPAFLYIQHDIERETPAPFSKSYGLCGYSDIRRLIDC